MSDRSTFPELPAWQRLRAELEPHSSGVATQIIGYIDRIIEHYDDAITRQIAFAELIDSLKVTAELIDKISLALSPNLPVASSIKEQAREILLQWLPNRIVEFSIWEVGYEVIRKDDETKYKQREVYIGGRLNNWLYLPALVEWQRLQGRLDSYRNSTLDLPLIQLIDKAGENYLPPRLFISYLEGISILMMQRKKFQRILTGGSTEKSRDNALKTFWAEARLMNWLRTELVKFKPNGKNATECLENWVYKYLHLRIENDFIDYLRYQSQGSELSTNAPIAKGDSNDESTLLDMIPSPSDLDNQIEALQEAEKKRRAFPIVVEFLKGLVNVLEEEHQQRWEVRFAKYVNEDPTHELRDTFYVEPSCNYQYLLQSLILPKLQGLPPKTDTDVCREFPAIGAHGLKSHIKRHFKPWADSVYLEILTDGEWSEFRDYLENIAANDLKTQYRKGFPSCNVFYLAQHRLPCFTSSPTEWSELAKLISTQDGKKIKPEYVPKFWQEECRLTLGKIACREILEYKMD
jgi:hypothetical protein